MHILDTHLHLVDLERFSYPWLESAPALRQNWSIESYWAEAKALGITGALHMEVDVTEKEMVAETEHVLGLDGIVGAIANGRPENADFIGHLEQLQALGKGKVKGIRRLLQHQPIELSAEPGFIAHIRRLPDYGMSFDICLKSHELPAAPPLIAACPQTQFVLDHCGNPAIAQGEWESWTVRMEEIAAYPNVVCKISGILANVDDSWTVDQLRPYVEFCIEKFGWDRVIWGSDHPVVTLFADLGKWVAATREIIAGASADEQARLLHGNAERLFGLSAPTA